MKSKFKARAYKKLKVIKKQSLNKKNINFSIYNVSLFKNYLKFRNITKSRKRLNSLRYYRFHALNFD